MGDASALTLPFLRLDDAGFLVLEKFGSLGFMETIIQSFASPVLMIQKFFIKIQKLAL